MTVLAAGSKALESFSESRLFNLRQMGLRAAFEGARGTPGPSWLPYDPSWSIGHHLPSWHICPGAQAF